MYIDWDRSVKILLFKDICVIPAKKVKEMKTYYIGVVCIYHCRFKLKVYF